MTDTFPVLYILMRDDLASMNAGKGMAQASHASNAFVWSQLKRMAKNPFKSAAAFFKVLFTKDDGDLFLKWVHETMQGFGTVLVVAVNEKQMRFTAEAAERYGLVSGVVHDPTYPLRDGETTHFIPLDTCAYVFTDKNDPVTDLLLGNFPLHP